jgi:predicted DNA-binding ribbon-helix-helix protein
MGDSRLVNRNVTAGGARTSIRLEPELWDALLEICKRERMTLARIVQNIETKRLAAADTGGRTSAVRVHIMEYFRAAATEAGHAAANHGALR